MYSRRGRLATGRSGLGVAVVKGRRRVPRPAARIIARIGYPLAPITLPGRGKDTADGGVLARRQNPVDLVDEAKRGRDER